MNFTVNGRTCWNPDLSLSSQGDYVTHRASWMPSFLICITRHSNLSSQGHCVRTKWRVYLLGQVHSRVPMKVLAIRLSPLPSSYFHIPTSLPNFKSTEGGEVRPQPSVPTDSETESSPFVFLALSLLLCEMSLLPEALYPGCICV